MRGYVHLGVAFKPSNDLELTLDYWNIKQSHKIDRVPFGFLYNASCNTQTSTVCVRGTPLPGDTLGPLQTVATTFVNIGGQSLDGIDLGGLGQ